MRDDDHPYEYDADHYEIDAHGNRVLIGLTAAETEEYIRLDATISEREPMLQSAIDQIYGPEERRWLELYERHETVRRPFLKSGKTMH